MSIEGRLEAGPNTRTMPDDRIRLGQFLKWVSLVGTGGEAKILIQQGEVLVNGEVETRRGRQLHPGDRVEVTGQTFVVPERLIP